MFAWLHHLAIQGLYLTYVHIIHQLHKYKWIQTPQLIAHSAHSHHCAHHHSTNTPSSVHHCHESERNSENVLHSTQVHCRTYRLPANIQIMDECYEWTCTNSPYLILQPPELYRPCSEHTFPTIVSSEPPLGITYTCPGLTESIPLHLPPTAWFRSASVLSQVHVYILLSMAGQEDKWDEEYTITLLDPYDYSAHQATSSDYVRCCADTGQIQICKRHPE